MFSGAHTIGQTICFFVRYRLYNYTGIGDSDPTINPEYFTELQTLCPEEGDGTELVSLDKDSQVYFDVNFFRNVRDGNGVLKSDQRLWENQETRRIVQKYTIRNFWFNNRFNFEFSNAMVKLGSIEVKTGTQGEIRNMCSVFNY